MNDHYYHSAEFLPVSSSSIGKIEHHADYASSLGFVPSSSHASTNSFARRNSDSAALKQWRSSSSSSMNTRKQSQNDSDSSTTTKKKFKLGLQKNRSHQRRNSLYSRLRRLSEQLRTMSSSELDKRQKSKQQSSTNENHDIESSHSSCGTIETCIETTNWEEEDAFAMMPPPSPSPSTILQSVPQCCPPLAHSLYVPSRPCVMVDKLPSDLYCPTL